MEMMHASYRWIQRWIIVLFTAMMGLILYIVIPVFQNTRFYLKRSFLLPQWMLVLVGLAGILMLCMLLQWRGCRGETLEKKRGLMAHLPELLLWLLLFFFQGTVSYFSYFLTDWDAGIILDTAYSIASYGYPEFLNHEYFSLYTNNVVITEFFAQIIRLFRFFAGDPGKDRCALVLIFVQCAINTGTGMLCRWSSERLTGSKRFSVAVGLVYVLFVGFSPWSMIPYSDGVGLILPIGIFCLYQLQENGKYWLPCWCGIGALTSVGMMIKPQAAIITIALVLVEGARLIASRRGKALLARVCSMLLVLAIGIGPVQNFCFEQSMLEVDTKRSVGPLHYVMLGLNKSTWGTYAAEDQQFSASYEEPQARTKAQLAEIRSRLEEMGPDGLLELMLHKTLINYGDGTFAWGINGFFFSKMLEDKDDIISPFLKDVLYTNGSRYPYFSTILQAIWLGLLAGCAFVCLSMRQLDERQRSGMCILCLAIIGLSLFEWIFEAKARYLYLYAPQYVMLGVWGIWGLCASVRKKIKGKLTEGLPS